MQWKRMKMTWLCASAGRTPVTFLQLTHSRVFQWLLVCHQHLCSRGCQTVSSLASHHSLQVCVISDLFVHLAQWAPKHQPLLLHCFVHQPQMAQTTGHFASHWSLHPHHCHSSPTTTKKLIFTKTFWICRPTCMHTLAYIVLV